MKKLTALFFLGLLLTFSASAQENKHPKKWAHDNNYYEMYPHKLTVRVLLNQKINEFRMPRNSGLHDANYFTNMKMGLGVGLTWHNYTLNGTFGPAFLNPDGDKRTKTKGLLNFQFHLYPRKWAIDLLTVFPKGMYLKPKGNAAPAGEYYSRPDIKFIVAGLAAYYVPNKEKFSYRAALVNNEWQKKSAGSWLFGGEAYYNEVRGDSALIPSSVAGNFNQRGILKYRALRVGPGAGFGYTVVVHQHFYIMGAGTANADITSVREEKDGISDNHFSLSPSVSYKAAIGYNTSGWAVSATFAGNSFWSKGSYASNPYFNQNAQFKVSISRKINTSGK